MPARCRRYRTLSAGGFLMGGFAGTMRAENAIEDRIDVAKLAIQIERVRQRGRVEILRNARVSGDSIAEARVALECRHRVFLHGFVGLIARHSLFDDILQELTGVDEAVR